MNTKQIVHAYDRATRRSIERDAKRADQRYLRAGTSLRRVLKRLDTGAAQTP